MILNENPKIEIINDDCLNYLKTLKDKSIDLILTDPPYPDYYTEEYGYKDGIINFLNDLDCRQIVFWSARVNFPLNYTAIHIWDKKVGAGSWYERIFERNGTIEYRVYRYYLINSTVAANYTKDFFSGHPSQKPIKLIEKLILENSKEGDTILDPFMGSGTTGVACVNLNRNFIGIEISKKYCDIATQRIKNTLAQPKLL